MDGENTVSKVCCCYNISIDDHHPRDGKTAHVLTRSFLQSSSRDTLSVYPTVAVEKYVLDSRLNRGLWLWSWSLWNLRSVSITNSAQCRERWDHLHDVCFSPHHHQPKSIFLYWSEVHKVPTSSPIVSIVLWRRIRVAKHWFPTHLSCITITCEPI